MSTLLIKNGTILSSEGSYQADIYVEGEKIVEIGQELNKEADSVVDAKGKYVFPGGIDQHVHMGPFGSYGFETTHAALIGGTTMVVDFAPQEPGVGLIQSMKNHKEKNADGVASCDYGFHTMVMDNDLDLLLEDLPHLVENGLTTLKFFMAYKGSPFYANDELILRGMMEAKKYGITMMLHAENGDMIEVMQDYWKKKGVRGPIGHSLSRPPIVEDEATYRGISMAKLADVPLYVVHVSEKHAMQHVKKAREEGYSVYGETCTQYLNFEESRFLEPDFNGGKYVCAPAIRQQEHLDALWDAIDKGYLKAVSSDNAAVIGGFESKKKGIDDFTKIPNGSPGMQNRLYMLWSQGVAKNRITKEKFVELTSTNPAKLLGLYPEKGAILPGSDADIVIYDPNVEGVIKFEDNYEGSDYEPYEGFERKGICEKVFLRGQLVAENGKFVGEKGKGKYIPSKPFGLAYDRYVPREDRTFEGYEKEVY